MNTRLLSSLITSSRDRLRHHIGPRPHGGFTLIELLVVIVILGVITAIVVFSVSGTGDKGADAARRTDADILRTAEESHFATKGEYAAEADLVRAGFLSEESSIHDIELGPFSPNGRYAIVCQAGTECSPPASPVEGGTLIVAIPGPTSGLLNPAVTTDGAVHANSEDMFSGLVGFDATGEPVGELAESWVFTDLAGGGQKARFNLRAGAFWHDDDPSGTRRPVTAADVEYTFEEVLVRYHSRTASALGPALGVTGSGDGATIPAASVEVIDATTVDLNFDYPPANLLRRLNVTEAPILPRHVYEPCGLGVATVAGCAANRSPVGSGPFRFESASATEIRSVRNPAYFRAGLPYLDGLTKRVTRLSDSAEEGPTSAEVEALRAGTIGWLAGVAPADVAGVVDDTTLRTFSAPRTSSGANCMSTLAFNLTAVGDVAAHTGGTPAPHPWLGGGVGSPGHSVRLALAQGFDRALAYSEIDRNTGRVAVAPISSALEGQHDPDVDLPEFNRAAAGDLLNAAGWIAEDPAPAPRVALGVAGVADGTELTLVLRHAQNAYQAAYAEALADQLSELGVDIEPVDTDYLGGVFTRRDFDLALVTYCHGDDAQVGVRRQYRSDLVSSVPFSNASGYANPAMDALWDTAAQAATPAAATAAYAEIQQAAVNDLPYVWLAETRNTRAHRGACTGFNHFNTGLFAEAAYCRPAAAE
ncbi:MAG: ABC transporter substrate-binding protein [Acidimicrobiales bacterium]